MSYPWHYLPQTVRAREAVQGGKLGQVLYISNMFSDTVHKLYRGDDMADTPEMAEQYRVEGPGDVYSNPQRSGGGQGHLRPLTLSRSCYSLLGCGRNEYLR